jgi:hypothetical protein
MLEQQFLTFLVGRVDAKLGELREVEITSVQNVAKEIKVFTDQMRLVIDHVFADEQDATQQRTITRRSRRNQIAEQQKTGGEQ